MDTGMPSPAHPGHREQRLRTLAVTVAVLLAGLYGLLFAGVLGIEGAEDAERGILGVAAAVFLVVAALLTWVRRRSVWVGAALLQVLMAAMYLAVAPGRDPSFEVWGLTARGLSLVLLVVLVALIVTTSRRRPASP